MSAYDPREDQDEVCSTCHEVVLQVVGNRGIPVPCRCDYEPTDADREARAEAAADAHGREVASLRDAGRWRE